MNLILYIILFLISFFPIVLWAYSFAFISNNPLNKKRFLFGILGGIISILPIFYLDNISNFFSEREYLNIFFLISQVQDLLSSFKFFIGLAISLTFIIFFSFLFGGFIFKKRGDIFKIYLKNFFVFLIFIFILSIVIFFLNFLLNYIDFQVSDKISFGDIIFDSFKLIIFYYIIVAFLEESSKHFNFLQSSGLKITSIKSGVESAIFVALGFSFVENIFYLYNYYLVNDLGYDFVKLYFMRSIFSIIVHILCSSLVAFYFSKAFLLYKEKNIKFSYLKVFFFGFSLALFFHLFFDVALSLGFNLVLFLYFVGGYLYVSSIFYKE